MTCKHRAMWIARACEVAWHSLGAWRRREAHQPKIQALFMAGPVGHPARTCIGQHAATLALAINRLCSPDARHGKALRGCDGGVLQKHDITNKCPDMLQAAEQTFQWSKPV